MAEKFEPVVPELRREPVLESSGLFRPLLAFGFEPFGCQSGNWPEPGSGPNCGHAWVVDHDALARIRDQLGAGAMVANCPRCGALHVFRLDKDGKVVYGGLSS